MGLSGVEAWTNSLGGMRRGGKNAITRDFESTNLSLTNGSLFMSFCMCNIPHAHEQHTPYAGACNQLSVAAAPKTLR